ncbi:MAG: 4Fe-4S binding protein [Candidatus Bathyarchaeia archaeon]
MADYEVKIDEELCKGCLICVYICMERGGNALKASDRSTVLGGTIPYVDEEECIGCRWCERYCPDFAISVEGKDDA